MARRDAKRDNKAMAYMLRHFVALSVTAGYKDGRIEREACSCFVIEVADRWFLVTAGHIIEGLEKLLSGGDPQVVLGLYDCWSVDTTAAAQVIPFNLQDSNHFSIDDEGLDVGGIEIEPLIRRALEAHKIEAVPREAWMENPKAWDHYFVMGLPNEFMEHEKTSPHRLTVEAASIPLTACEPSAAITVPKFKPLYARLPPGIGDVGSGLLSNIKGMSGGPIYGSRQIDGRWQYGLVAVQGGWFRTEGIIAGTLMRVVGRAIEAEIEKEKRGTA